jgi:hypothetical protein
MIVGLVAQATALTPRTALVAQLVLGAVAGLAAAVAMHVPMSRRSDVFAPAHVAVGVLRRAPPDEVSALEANVAHHGAGAMAGVLHALFVAVLVGTLPRSPSVDGVELLPHLLAVALIVAIINAVFAHLVLPRVDRSIYEEQATAVRGQWLRSSLVFGAALAFIAPLLFSFVV